MMIDALARPVHFSSVRTTDATIELVQLDRVLEWLHVSDSYETSTIEDLIAHARHKVETDTGLAIGTQTWTLTFDRIPSDGIIRLPMGPVQSVTSLTAYSPADVGSVVATSVYRVDTSSLPPRIVLKENQSWPSDVRPQDAFVVVYVAGYATVAALPKTLTQAVQLLVAHWFAHREPVATSGAVPHDVPLTYTALVEQLAVRGVW